jgi:hypothetical protein
VRRNQLIGSAVERPGRQLVSGDLVAKAEHDSRGGLVVEFVRAVDVLVECVVRDGNGVPRKRADAAVDDFRHDCLPDPVIHLLESDSPQRNRPAHARLEMVARGENGPARQNPLRLELADDALGDGRNHGAVRRAAGQAAGIGEPPAVAHQQRFGQLDPAPEQLPADLVDKARPWQPVRSGRRIGVGDHNCGACLVRGDPADRFGGERAVVLWICQIHPHGQPGSLARSAQAHHHQTLRRVESQHGRDYADDVDRTAELDHDGPGCCAHGPRACPVAGSDSIPTAPSVDNVDQQPLAVDGSRIGAAPG